MFFSTASSTALITICMAHRRGSRSVSAICVAAIRKVWSTLRQVTNHYKIWMAVQPANSKPINLRRLRNMLVAWLFWQIRGSLAAHPPLAQARRVYRNSDRA
jgi:hypothetical protein